MGVLGVVVNMRSFINTSVKQWNRKLTAGNQRQLRNVNIKREIFQGDSLPPILFCIGDETVKIGVKVDKGILRIKGRR